MRRKITKADVVPHWRGAWHGMIVSNSQKLGAVPLPVIGTLTLLFGAFGIGAELVFESVLLVALLNVFLVLGVSVVVARISAKSFLSTGSVNVLLLGTAVLAFGTMATLGGAVSSINVDRGVAMYVTGALTAGCLHLTSAILTYRGSPRRTSHLKRRVIISYTGTITFLAVLSVLAVSSALPASFEESGSLVQKATLAVVVSLFTLSAIFFSKVYIRSRNPILYWYSLALWATALGFVSFAVIRVTGDPLLWTGIVAVCTGSVYFLLSMLAMPKTGSPRTPGQHV